MKTPTGLLLRATAPSLLLVIFWFSLPKTAAAAADFRLRVANLKSGDPIPQRYLYNRSPCAGQNLSPEVSWEGAPDGTKSFAFVVWDEDAPKRGGFYHWILTNLPRSDRTLAEGAGTAAANRAPRGAVQLINDWGKPGYGGPCPPGGKPHHYHFTVYALKTDGLPIDGKTKVADAITQVRSGSLGSAESVLVAWR